MCFCQFFAYEACLSPKLLCIFSRKISRVAPTRGTWLRMGYWVGNIIKKGPAHGGIQTHDLLITSHARTINQKLIFYRGTSFLCRRSRCASKQFDWKTFYRSAVFCLTLTKTRIQSLAFLFVFLSQVWAFFSSSTFLIWVENEQKVKLITR